MRPAPIQPLRRNRDPGGRSARAPAVPRRRTAVDVLGILRADPTLQASYLLRFAGDPGTPPLDEARAERFLLWFAVEGRLQAQQVRFTPDYIAFLAEPAPPFPSRLASHICALCGGLDRFGHDPERFARWYRGVGAERFQIGPLLAPKERAADDCDGRDLLHLPGINVVGIADGISGIGEDARALTKVLLAAGAMQSIVNVRYPSEIVATDRIEHDSLVSDRPLFPVNVFCLPPFETARLKLGQGENLFAGRYNVGYWPWELSSLPPDCRFVFDLVDEVWASSEYLVDVFRRLTAKPVTYMPPYVGVPRASAFSRQRIGLDTSDLVFLCLFDLNSYIARKNPSAAIAAFRAAFPEPGGRERLVIKTLSGEANPRAFAALRAMIEEDERIVLLDGALPRAEACGLLAAADCYVSLHRAEGFGRVIAEAMLLGVPVMATDWSGSASFLNPDTGWPVAYRLRALQPAEYIASEGSVWAEPSVEDAARIMRQIRDHPAEVDRRRRLALSAMSTYGLDAAAQRVEGWLAAYAAKAGRR